MASFEFEPYHPRGYVETKGDYHDTSVRLGGHAWEKSGQIWMSALDVLSSDADFNEFVRVTVEVAFQRFSRTEQEAVAAAWAGVGLPVPLSTTARHFAIKPPKPALPHAEARDEEVAPPSGSVGKGEAMYTHHEITRLLRGWDGYQLKQQSEPAPTNDPEIAKRNFVKIYRFARPVLMGFTASPLCPATFRAVIGALIAAADLYFNLNPPPAMPAAVEAASSDSPTTDPTSTDPSFKAGKDL